MSVLKLDDGEICDIICSTFVYLKIPIIKRLFKKVNLLRKKRTFCHQTPFGCFRTGTNNRTSSVNWLTD